MGRRAKTPDTTGHAVTVLLFEGFEALDVFGPVELFSCVPGWSIEYAGPSLDPVPGGQGVRLLPDRRWEDLIDGTDLLLVPGGMGTRPLAENEAFLDLLRRIGANAGTVASVCTGSALLAAAGLLEGCEATSNKRAFAWASSFGRDVRWRRRARWVHDGSRWTSSGVAAGMDMASALVAAWEGEETAREICRRIELETHADPSWDPFADPGPSSPDQ